MEHVTSQFTLLFKDPFWVGVYERQEAGTYAVCKITFGSQPTDGQVYEFLLKNYMALPFHTVKTPEQGAKKDPNPKRLQRQIHAQVRQKGVGTKAQQALAAQHEQNKQARKTQSKQERQGELQRRFALHQAKKKERHRGH